jgi:hypothetical protein
MKDESRNIIMDFRLILFLLEKIMLSIKMLIYDFHITNLRRSVVSGYYW